MIQIADKWTIIDIRAEDISGLAHSYIIGSKESYTDRDSKEHLYCTNIFMLSEILTYIKSTEVIEELQLIGRLAEENDAFYIRIIYT